MEMHEFKANPTPAFAHPASCVQCGRPNHHPIHNRPPTDSQIAGTMYQLRLLLIATGFNMDGIEVWDMWKVIKLSYSGRSGGKRNDPAPSSSAQQKKENK